MVEITYCYKNGKKETFEIDFTNAYIEFRDKIIYKKNYPNVFEALTGVFPTSHHFNFRVIPTQGVKLTKI